MDPKETSAALRQIAKGFDALAAAIADEKPPEVRERDRAIVSEWGERGLSREEASALFRKHGLAPQAVGGWVRGEWIELREDGLRYLSERSLSWLAEQEDGDG